MDNITSIDKNILYVSEDSKINNLDFLVERIINNSVVKDIYESKNNENNFLEQESNELKIDYSLPTKNNLFLFSNSKPLNYSKKTNRWIGIVTKIKQNTFESKLEDLDIMGTYEIGEFDFSDISPEDLPLVEEGAVFYWSVGQVMDKGQLKKEFMIRFKRSIPLTVKELDEIEDWAEHKHQSLNWD